MSLSQSIQPTVFQPLVETVIEPALNEAIDQAVQDQVLFGLRFSLEFFAEVLQSRNSQVAGILRDLLQLNADNVGGAQSGNQLFGVDFHDESLSRLNDFVSAKSSDSEHFENLTKKIDGLLDQKTKFYYPAFSL